MQMSSKRSTVAGLLALATVLTAALPASAGPSPSNDIFVWNSEFPSPVALADVSEPLDGKRLVRVSTGGQHPCALDRAGRAYCWGSDEYASSAMATCLVPRLEAGCRRPQRGALRRQTGRDRCWW